jgi:hypothetical protein
MVSSETAHGQLPKQQRASLSGAAAVPRPSGPGILAQIRDIVGVLLDL